VRTLEDNRDAVRSTLTHALARALANLFWRQSEPRVPAYSTIPNGEDVKVLDARVSNARAEVVIEV
jgi:hypothetical protein